MSTIRAPIDALLQKNSTFNWDQNCHSAFAKFKEILLSGLLLAHYDPLLPVMIAADASSTGIGAVAYHSYPNGSIKAFHHISRRLAPAERNYSQVEKEGLGIIYAVKKFHKYIFGRRFTIYTDHRPLLSIFGGIKGVPVHTANRLQRWAIILLAYDFDIKFTRTEDFGHADVLSRLIADQPRANEDVVIAQITASEEKEVLSSDLTRFHGSFNFETIARESARDPDIQRVIGFISSRWPHPSKTNSREVSLFYAIKDELSVVNDILIFRDRTVVPACLRKRVLVILHKAHPGINRMKALARCYVYWPGIDGASRSWSPIAPNVNRPRNCQLEHVCRHGQHPRIHGSARMRISLGH